MNDRYKLYRAAEAIDAAFRKLDVIATKKFDIYLFDSALHLGLFYTPEDAVVVYMTARGEDGGYNSSMEWGGHHQIEAVYEDTLRRGI